MNIVESVRLFFQEGTSDKVYEASIVEDSEGVYSVLVAWGRRNANLNQGKKANGVSLADAKKAYDRVVRQKTKKGYQAITETVQPSAVSPPVGQGSGSRAGVGGRSRVGPKAQLLNAVDEARLEALFADPEIVAQQKFDGVRILTLVQEDGVVATNRSGEMSEFGAAVLQAVSHAPPGTILDGELVSGSQGPVYWLFDILQYAGEDLKALGYVERFAHLAAACAELPDPIEMVDAAFEEADKRALYNQLRELRAEGIVFKRVDAPYTHGRPGSGGTQLKYKFVKTCDVFITENAGNAYQMAVFDAAGMPREIGKVFAGTTNDTRSEIDDALVAGARPVAEVRYLYATRDDILFQPVFVRLRDDKAPSDCVLDQLERTNRDAVGAIPSDPS